MASRKIIRERQEMSDHLYHVFTMEKIESVQVGTGIITLTLSNKTRVSIWCTESEDLNLEIVSP